MEKHIIITVDQRHTKKSVKAFFEYANVGKKTIHFLKMANAISVNGIKANDTFILKENDKLVIDYTNMPATTVTPFESDIIIVYEDDHIVVVDKPTKLLVHEDGQTIDTLTNRVNAYYQALGYPFSVLPAHRIDYETSGMVVFGKHPFSLSYLSNLFEQRSIKKIYQAIVEGDFIKKEGKIDAPIGAHRHENIMMVSSTGKKATSLYKVINKNGNENLVEIEIIGGRKHQIRVHMAHIGFPIKGDPIYGIKSDRLYLHFYKVSFENFVNGKLLTVTDDARFKME